MDPAQLRLVAPSLTSIAVSTIASSIASASRTTHSNQTSAPSLNLISPVQAQSHGDKHGNMEEWSSLIGIVTALAGNVLISLALNIQRYAHIRITREWEQRKARSEAGRSRKYDAVAVSDSRQSLVGSRTGTSRDQSRHGEHEEFEPYSDDIDAPPRNARPSQGYQNGGRRSSKASDRSEHTDEPENRKSYLQSPYWWAGIVLMVLGETGNFLAYGFAPASIVSPLGVVALISNCVIAPCLLKERFRKRDFWGVLVAIAGAVVVVLSASSSEEKIGPGEIWMMITRWEFELYMGLTASLIITLMWASFSYGSQSILIDVGLVALFGGYTALSTKGVSSLLSFTLWHVITFPITYLLVFVLVTSALMQIRYINRALQRFDSTQVIPTQFVLFTLSVIVGSAILYRDFESMSAARAGKFIGGCALTFLGVYFITSGRVRSDDDSTFSTDDEEERIGLLDGERYHDRIDLSAPGPHSRATTVSANDREQETNVQSPGVSLNSRGLEIVDDDQLTPKGALSSPDDSLTAQSPLSGRFLDDPSPLRPPSRMSNPWAESSDEALVTPASDLETYCQNGPLALAAADHQVSTVSLRFPPAPGIEQTSRPNLSQLRRASTPMRSDQAIDIERSQANLETPSRRAIRNSISNRFSPGPLLPTLSGGFSAVVADSLRRGEGSPLKDRARRSVGRRRQLSGTFDAELARYQDQDLRLDEPSDSLSVAGARLQSATGLAVPSTNAGRSTSALPTTDQLSPMQNPRHEGNRLRSLSDSWSGGLAWLGGALRMTSQDQAKLIMPNEQEDRLSPTEQGQARSKDRSDDADPRS
ncbi:hypothetical protein N7539_000184 [Penicillium diatomitis]|uniref:DUF803 domain membrane protein n=1 Tax=Penicillium diatomitis TaxID=2819901 RepID=A0A9X0C1Y5_9EURO|nr:uncharacterized protein N7539_000184 [Penicillium diatomitis]KAJ5495068.1 hypothetical protein N7539_000184 [Penicillium diatomitis]